MRIEVLLLLNKLFHPLPEDQPKRVVVSTNRPQTPHGPIDSVEGVEWGPGIEARPGPVRDFVIRKK